MVESQCADQDVLILQAPTTTTLRSVHDQTDTLVIYNTFVPRWLGS